MKVPSVTPFVQETPQALNAIEEQIVQGKFSKLAQDKMGWVDTIKTTAAHWFQTEHWDNTLAQVERG